MAQAQERSVLMRFRAGALEGSLRAASIIVAASVLVLCVVPRTNAQSVPGLVVTRYAAPVAGPVRLEFAPDGTLFCGRDDNPSGTATPAKISRIDPNSRVSTEYGGMPTPDPDVVLFDSAGVIAGIPGSVITGGIVTSPLGRISAIHPDGTIATLWESTTITNPTEMKFDSSNRLLFSELFGRKVMVSTGGMPTTLFSISGTGAPGYLAIDASDRIYTSSNDGRIRVHAADGTLLDDSLVSFNGYAAIEFGVGGVFGTDLYALELSSQTLYRVDSLGTRTVFGTGFDAVVGDIEFGRFGDLYVGLNVRDSIVRISDSTATGLAPGGAVTAMALRPHPNPFASEVTIEFGRTIDGATDVAIYDYAGRLVRRLAGPARIYDSSRLVWDGRDADGRDVGAGAFVIRVEGGARVVSQKIIRVR